MRKRIGITWAEAADNVLVAAANRAAGGWSVYNLDMTVEYIQTCAMSARAFDYAAQPVGAAAAAEHTPRRLNAESAINSKLINHGLTIA